MKSPVNNKTLHLLLYSTLLIVGVYFFFLGLVRGKSFLAPIAVAAILAMVILPVANWFEHKGMKRVWAALCADLLILFFFAVLTGILAFQIKRFSEEWPSMQRKLEPKINQLQQYISEKTGLTIQEQKQKIQESIKGASSSGGSEQTAAAGKSDQQARQDQPQQQDSGQTQGQQTSTGGGLMAKAGSFIMKFIGFVGTSLLVLVYIFFFLLYRKKFKDSLIRIAPDDTSEKTGAIIANAAEVSQNYLFGRLIEIVFVAIVYSIGLLISGVQNAILISILGAVLILIPYLGNVIAYVLALGFALFSGGGMGQVIGVTVTFGLTQFIETYTLEPYLVGGKVNLNPVATILVVVLGNALWGVVGMLVAIPALGIAKVIFDNVPVLNPLGYLLGEEDTDGESVGMFDKAMHWVTDKFR
ncbi:MAG: AI-2E family transporter [Bacteroidetes bacterium]|nr:AI-2E family transporter [Bacteroidota bacterium]